MKARGQKQMEEYSKTNKDVFGELRNGTKRWYYYAIRHKKPTIISFNYNAVNKLGNSHIKGAFVALGMHYSWRIPHISGNGDVVFVYQGSDERVVAYTHEKITAMLCASKLKRS